jgi:hypothetical protein
VEPLTAEATPVPVEGGTRPGDRPNADAETDARDRPPERLTARDPQEPLPTLELGALEGWRVKAAVAGQE